jgi:hypothetical protein
MNLEALFQPLDLDNEYSPVRHVKSKPGWYIGSVPAGFIAQLAAAREYRAVAAIPVLQRAVVDRQSWKIPIDSGIKALLGWHRNTWPPVLGALAAAGATKTTRNGRLVVAICRKLCDRDVQFCPYTLPIESYLQAINEAPAAGLAILVAQRQARLQGHNLVELKPHLQALGMERHMASRACQALQGVGLLHIQPATGLQVRVVLPGRKGKVHECMSA